MCTVCKRLSYAIIPAASWPRCCMLNKPAQTSAAALYSGSLSACSVITPMIPHIKTKNLVFLASLHARGLVSSSFERSNRNKSLHFLSQSHGRLEARGWRER